MIHSQMQCVQVMKSHPDLQQYTNKIQESVKMFMRIITNHCNGLVNCTQSGISTYSEFVTFMENGIEEIMIYMVYNSLTTKKTKIVLVR